MDRAASFIARLGATEQELQSLRKDMTEYFQAQKQPAVPVAPRPERPKPEPAVPNRAPSFDSGRLEALIAGRGFYAAGLLLIFLAAGFFLKIAFDNWIGPLGRIGIGVMLGIAVIAGATRVDKPEFRRYADGLIALGFAIELVAIYAATMLYALLPQGAGFAALVLVIAAISTFAYKRNSETLAICAAVGGFLAPPIINATASSHLTYTAYLFALNIALAGLAFVRSWKNVSPVLLFGTIISYSVYLASDDSTTTLFRAVIAILFYAIFAWLPTVADDNKAKLVASRIIAAIWLMLTISSLVGSDQHSGAILLGTVAAMHVWLAAQRRSLLELRFAFGFLTQALTYTVHGTALNAVYSLEALSLYYIGVKKSDMLLRVAGFGLLAVNANALGSIIDSANGMLFINPRFVNLCLGATALLIASQLIRRYPDNVSALEHDIVKALPIAGHALIVSALSFEAWDIGSAIAGHNMINVMSDLPQVMVSITWAACAGFFIALGLKRADSNMRWEGLALITAVVVKVLSVDLSSQDLVYRVASALIVGIVAIIIAAQYQGRIAKSSSIS